MTTPNFSGEAKLFYLASDFDMLETGAYVTCAVTSERIPIDRLKYWSADLQEAYKDAETSTKRWLETRKSGTQA